jgi:hypothetical protein
MLKIWGHKHSRHVQAAPRAGNDSGSSFEGLDAGMAFGVNHKPERKPVTKPQRPDAGQYA